MGWARSKDSTVKGPAKKAGPWGFQFGQQLEAARLKVASCKAQVEMLQIAEKGGIYASARDG